MYNKLNIFIQLILYLEASPSTKVWWRKVAMMDIRVTVAQSYMSSEHYEAECVYNKMAQTDCRTRQSRAHYFCLYLLNTPYNEIIMACH